MHDAIGGAGASSGVSVAMAVADATDQNCERIEDRSALTGSQPPVPCPSR